MDTDNRYDQTVDVTGKHCPAPVIRCKAALAALRYGQMLQLVATDPDCLHEIPRLISALGDQLVDVDFRDNRYCFSIRRTGSRQPNGPGASTNSLLDNLAEYLQSSLSLQAG